MVAGHPGGFKVHGPGLNPLVGGQRLSGGQPVPADRGGPCIVTPEFIRASFCASSRRWRAAPGSAFSTARPIAARICPGVFPAMSGATSTSAAAAPASSSTRVTWAMMCALYGSMTPSHQSASGAREPGGKVVGQCRPSARPPNGRWRGRRRVRRPRVPLRRNPASGEHDGPRFFNKHGG